MITSLSACYHPKKMSNIYISSNSDPTNTLILKVNEDGKYILKSYSDILGQSEDLGLYEYKGDTIFFYAKNNDKDTILHAYTNSYNPQRKGVIIDIRYGDDSVKTHTKVYLNGFTITTDTLNKGTYLSVKDSVIKEISINHSGYFFSIPAPKERANEFTYFFSYSNVGGVQIDLSGGWIRRGRKLISCRNQDFIFKIK
jgi:hypothetical protein